MVSDLNVLVFNAWWWFPLLCRNFLVSYAVLLLIFAFDTFTFWSNSNSHPQDWCQGACCLCFLLRVYGLGHTFKSSVFWVSFCVWYKRVVQFHSFACGCPIFPALFIEKTVLLHSQVALAVKNPPGNAGDIKRCGFDPWVGKIPWRRAWQPTPVFLPRESHGQRSLVG